MTLNDKRIFTATAPGRLDVMGGIADYSGSLVLQMPLQAHTHVQITLRDENHCTFKSTTDSGETLSAETDYIKLLSNQQVDYSFAQKILKEKHLKLFLEKDGQQFDAIWFNHTEGLPILIRAAYRLDANEYNGRTKVQLLLEYAEAV